MIKVNGFAIFDITTHKDVLIEQKIKDLKFPEEVPVYFCFDYDKLIGVARLRQDPKGRIYADISLFGNIPGYPAIGYITSTSGEKSIYCVGICEKRNADKSILRIGI